MAILDEVLNVVDFTQTNLALVLDNEDLKKLGADALMSYNQDQSSRMEWLDKCRMWLAKAAQYTESKSYPWPGAANIKFPLLTNAALQFHARAHQNLLKGTNLVRVKVNGKDPEKDKQARANRVSTFMSGQLLYAMEEWSDDTDQMLFLLPLIGTMYRKVYWSPSLGRAISELVLPQDLVINYDAPDMGRARKSHHIYKTRNEIHEMVEMKIWADVRAMLPSVPSRMPDEVRLPAKAVDNETQGLRATTPDDQTPFTFVEQHTWFDLDGDGYQEPYIITFELHTKAVVSLRPRWDIENGLVLDETGGVARIKPVEYFIPYRFLPSFDSKIYGLGLGHLLGPTNEAVDTLINQVIDSGTLSNMPSGYLGRGARTAKGGRNRFRPGEWKQWGSATEDLRKQVFPLPVKEPSQTLFQLLGMLIGAGEKIGSVTDMMQGESPGQNTAFSVVQATIEQGMQVFNGIYKRIYRSMSKEYRFLYALYYDHLDPDVYNGYLDETEIADVQADFAPDGFDVVPIGDPDLMANLLKIKRAEQILQLSNQGLPFNQMAVAQIFVESLDISKEQSEALMDNPAPQPDLKLQFEMSKWEDEKMLKAAELRIDAAAKQYEGMKDFAHAQLNLARAQTEAGASELAELTAMLDDLQKRKEFALKQTSLAQDGLNKVADRRVKENEISSKAIPGGGGA